VSTSARAWVYASIDEHLTDLMAFSLDYMLRGGDVGWRVDQRDARETCPAADGLKEVSERY
jgi:hypothetical protein